MRLYLQPAARIPRWPWWALAFTALWAGVVLVSLGLSRHSGQAVNLCLFKNITTLPCPTCGCTRAALALLQGDILLAIRFNPLVMACAAIASALLTVRMLAGRRVVLQASKMERKILWTIALLLAAGNWYYVIQYVG